MNSTTLRRSLLASVAIMTFAAAPNAFAQDAAARDATEVPENDDSLTIGAGAAYVPSYQGSDDYNVIPGAALRGKISGHNFYTRGSSFYFDLIPEKPDNSLDLSFGPVVGARFQRTRRIKDDQVEALGKLDTAIEVGAFAGIAKTGLITSDYDTLSFRVSYVRDVANTHDSYILTPAIEYGTPLSPAIYVGIGASADYVGNGYASTYYSVTPAGTAASGLSTFDADKGWKNITSTLFASYSLSGDLRKGWALFAAGSYSKMLGDFKRSPLVSEAGDANQWFGAFGVGYTF